MQADVVPHRMNHNFARFHLVSAWPVVRLVLIASDTGINEVFVTIITASRNRMIVIYGQLAAGIYLRDTAITTLKAIPRSNTLVLRMRHQISLLRPAPVSRSHSMLLPI